MKKISRCPWVPVNDPLYVTYHDTEWGVPLYDDKKIYEFLVLEAFQAGLSWRTILHKRAAFKKAFKDFNPRQVAAFTASDVTALLDNSGIIRHRKKIEAAITNAQQFIAIQKEYGSFATYMWSWVNGAPIQHTFHSLQDYVSYTPHATAWARDLKKRGFKFLGPTVVYAHMQAVGMVNDHTDSCFKRHAGQKHR